MSNRWMLVLLSLLAFGAAAAENSAEDPLKFVKSTADQVLSEVSSRKDELSDDPGMIYELVDQVILPRFDFVRMSQLVLGKYWRRATPAQKQAFVREFRELLIRTYATALLNYSGQDIVYLPVRAGKNVRKVTVNTQVRETGRRQYPSITGSCCPTTAGRSMTSPSTASAWFPIIVPALPPRSGATSWTA